MAAFNGIHESKKHFLEVKENVTKYISGELDFNLSLDKTEKLYLKTTEGQPLASKAFQDSDLIKLQTKIAKECARNYQVDTLVFDASLFCSKVKTFLCPDEDLDASNGASTSSRKVVSNVWKKLGDHSKVFMNTVPTFSFIYGTFDADPIEPVRKKKKQVIKDKVGDLTKPLSVNPESAKNEHDVMLEDVKRVYTIFSALAKKSTKRAICFYEFVTDPDSFTRTVENIFLVSLLVKEGVVCIFPDDNGLPCLRKVHSSEKDMWDTASTMQSVLTICQDDWKSIVKTFKFKKAVIPSRTTQ